MPRPPNEIYAKWLRFKLRWEKQYPGETYLKNPKDFRFCKEVLVDVPDQIMDERMEVFFRNDWHGEHNQHSLSAFANNINTFISKEKGELILFDCPNCGKKHRPHDKCSGDAVTMPKEVSEALTLLTKKLSAG